MDEDQTVDLHGRPVPWRFGGHAADSGARAGEGGVSGRDATTRAQRAAWWENHGAAKQSEAEMAELLATEQPIVVPVDAEGRELPITSETLPKWLTVS